MLGCLVALTFHSIEAQVRTGLKLGFNLSNVRGTDKLGESFDYKMKPGGQFGIEVNIPVAKSFAVQTGLQASMLGYTWDYTTQYDNVRKYTLFYLQLPANVQYKIDLGAVDLIAQAGPYIGMGIAGRQAYYKNGKKQSLGTTDKKLTMGGNENSDDYKSFDWGLNVGAGIQFNRFQVMVNYQAGLYNIDHILLKKDQNKMYNNNLCITATVFFGKGFE